MNLPTEPFVNSSRPFRARLCTVRPKPCSTYCICTQKTTIEVDTPYNADLLKGFAEISKDVEIRPSERKAAHQAIYRLKKAKRSD